MTDLLALARALLRETGELSPGGNPAAAGSPTPTGGTAGGGPSGLVTPAQLRGPLPKEQKKFYKLGAPVLAPPAADPTAAPVSSASPGEKDEPVTPPVRGFEASEGEAFPEEPAAAASVSERRGRPSQASNVAERTGGKRRSFTKQQRTTFLFLTLLFTGLAFAAGLGFGALFRPAPRSVSAAPGRVANAAVPAVPPRPGLLTLATAPDEVDRRALQTLGEALSARQARDWPRAAALFERAGQESSRVPGVPYHLAEMALRRGDSLQADTLATRAQELGENVDEAFALRAILAQRAGNSNRALSLLEAASRANPYESRYWLYQAQILRQTGKLQKAVERLRGAALRSEEPAQVELIELFVRLTKLELGQEAEFSGELATKLAAPVPPPDWLLTAAARDFQHERFADGANTLRRALEGQPLPFIALRLNDIFFRRFATRPELALLYAQLLPALSPVPLVNLVPPPSPAAPAASPGDASSALPMSPDVPATLQPTPAPATGGGKSPR